MRSLPRGKLPTADLVCSLAFASNSKCIDKEVILWQPENEYSSFGTGQSDNPAYMQYVENQARKAGIVVPFISNDAGPDGHNTPGSGTGAVDIYGHDGYP